MLESLQILREELIDWWDNLMWQASDERREIATLRLAAHKQAMSEGYESPYTDPENYNSAWQPITKRIKTSE